MVTQQRGGSASGENFDVRLHQPPGQIDYAGFIRDADKGPAYGHGVVVTHSNGFLGGESKRLSDGCGDERKSVRELAGIILSRNGRVFCAVYCD